MNIEAKARQDAAFRSQNALANAVGAASRSVEKMIGGQIGKSAEADVTEIIVNKVYSKLKGK